MSEGVAQEDPAKSASGSLPGSGPGSLLLAARERLGVSPQEVADELKLTTHVIEALEKDDYAGMPPTVFSRGYLRSYARLLDLDPDALLKLYPQLTQEPEPRTQVSALPLWKRKEMIQVIAVAAAGLVVVIVLLSMLFGAGDEETAGATRSSGSSETATSRAERAAPGVTPAPTNAALRAPITRPELPTAPATEQASSDKSAEVEDEVEDVVRVDVEDELPRAPTPISRSTESATAPAPVAERPSPPPVREVVAQPASTLVPIAAGERRITESGDDRLIFTFAADCWVEVRSAEGGRLYSDLNRTGRRLELVGDGPFRVLLGYAPGVELSFNGESVPLAALTRNNVANLVLGQ